MAQTVLEAEERLSRSRLWRMQRAFFEARGIDAWRRAIVPHYVTSNPFIAAAYAQLVLGYWRDCWPTLSGAQPLYLVELGAGSGRFAFHFLRRLTALLPRSTLADVRFTYVLTDVAERNLQFLAGHPALRPFVAAGQLDFARFDATCDDALVLRERDVTLGRGDVANPLVAIANYVFDGVPQDMFYVERGRLHESLVTLGCEPPSDDPDDPALIERVALRWSRRAVAVDVPLYDDARRDAILEHYRARLGRGAFSFPTAALRALDALAALANGQLLLVSADKGQSHEAALAGREEPPLTVHGSFSLPVNYHAIGEYARRAGGKAFCTTQPHALLNVCAFTLGALPGDHVETALAFEQAIERLGPDDFYCIKKALEPRLEELSLEQLLAWVRLSDADVDVLLRCLPALGARLAEASAAQRRELARLVTAAWAGHFSIDANGAANGDAKGDAERDVAFELGGLLCDVQAWDDALPLFEASLAQHGADRATLFNLALCRARSGRPVEALPLVAQLIGADPLFEAAQALRREIAVALAGVPAG
jgi:hypothetical protein